MAGEPTTIVVFGATWKLLGAMCGSSNGWTTPKVAEAETGCSTCQSPQVFRKRHRQSG